MSRGVRVGTDLVHVEGVAESVQRFGARYLDRIYTPAEIAYCRSSPTEMPRRLAARFAAKEACLKVLRPTQAWMDWRDMEVVKMPGGWCELELHGDARQLADRAGMHSFSVSLSHEQAYAVAVVAASLDQTDTNYQTPGNAN
ncbi:MAG: holo-ACP synthase [Pseudomonadota bacterium]